MVDQPVCRSHRHCFVYEDADLDAQLTRMPEQGAGGAAEQVVGHCCKDLAMVN
nr:hypothetical protein [Candidatus Erwinia dacicola]